MSSSSSYTSAPTDNKPLVIPSDASQEQNDSIDENIQPTSDIITINVGGREFTTFISTLTSESTYFARLFSKDWAFSLAQTPRLNGHIFIDANARLFEHLLLYFQRLSFPLFWSRDGGFDYRLYAELKNEAAFFGVTELEEWIANRRYTDLIRVENWISWAEEGGFYGKNALEEKCLNHSSEVETFIDRTEFLRADDTRCRRIYKNRVYYKG